MDEIHDDLDQRIFNGTDPRRNKIKFIRDHFMDGIRELVPNPQEYFDLYLTGSLTTYQYSDNSDCDISVFPRYDELVKVLNVESADEVRRALIRVVIKKLDGVIVPGTQHPVQHFVVLVGNKPADLYKPGMRSAWSFQTESWFVPPEKDRVHNVKQELPLIYLRAHAIADKMRVALDTDPLAAKRLFQRIHIKRTQDQRAGRGDFSEGNIVYKYLLHEGLFDRLRQIGIYIAKTAGTPLGFDDWTCPECGEHDVYEDPEGGFECRHCGMAIVSKKLAAQETQIIYDFYKDRIILGTKAEAAAIPNSVLVGHYKDGHATMYEAAHQWLNTAYFKKLWYHSFPTWPLSSISLSGPQGPQRIAAELEPNQVAYVQAFIYLDGDKLKGTLTEDRVAEHSELLEKWMDKNTEYNIGLGMDPDRAEQGTYNMVMRTPKTAGHIGAVYPDGVTPQYLAVFYSDFMSGQLTASLKSHALVALQKQFPNIIEAPEWAYKQRWYQGV